MKIEHLQLQWEDLPRTDEVLLQPVEKTYLKIIYIEWAIFYTVLLTAGIALIYFIPGFQSLFLVFMFASIFIVIVLSTFWLAKKDFQFKAYGIRERDVMSQSGWLFQKLEVIPISKIQYCVVKKGPLEQKFKLASLRLFTAGQQSDITLSGLKAEEAERLKKWIISKQGEDA